MTEAHDVRQSASPSSPPESQDPVGSSGGGGGIRRSLRGMSYDAGAQLLTPVQRKLKGSLGSKTDGFETGNGSNRANWNGDDTTVKGGKPGGGFDHGDLKTRIGQTEEQRNSGKGLDPGISAGKASGVDAAEAGGGMFGDDPVGGAKTKAVAGAYAGAGGEATGFVAGIDEKGWLEGNRASVAGSVGTKAGVGASAGANAATEGGPELGSIDPATNKRKGMASAQAGAGAEGFVGVRGGGAGEAYAQGLGVGAAGSASIEAGVGVSGQAGAKAGVEIGGLTLAGAAAQGSAGASAAVGGNASGEVKAGVGTTVLGAKGTAGVSALAAGEAKGSASATVGGLHGRVEGNVRGEAGATASASGEVVGGPGSVGARGEAEAFAGARASGSIGVAHGALGIDLMTMSLTGSVAAGVGAGVGGGLMIKDGVLYVDAELLAAAGVGGSVGVSFSIDLLFPFHALFKMLEANGVLSARPENFVTEILGYILQKKSLGGGGKEKPSTGGDRRIQRDLRAPARGADPDAAIYQAFEQAGAKVDRRAGTIDTRGPAVDPMKLIGALPGEAGKRYDATIGKAGASIGRAQSDAAAAPRDLSAGISASVNESFGSIVELVNGALSICRNTIEMVTSLVTSGVEGALQKGAALMDSAFKTAKAAIETAASWFLRLFQWLGNLFTGFDKERDQSGAALVNDLGLVFQGALAVVSGNQAQLAALAPALAQVAAKLASDGGGFAQAAGKKAADANAEVVRLDGQPLDLGEFSGKIAISDGGRQDFAQVASLVSSDGRQAAQASAGQLAGLPGKIGELGNQSATTANTATAAGTGKARQAFGEKSAEANTIARDGKTDADKDGKESEAARKRRA